MAINVFTRTAELKSYIQQIKQKGLSIGLVPTMGALHQGHAELLRRSKAENKVTVLSIFVNPTQFNNVEDLAKYPKTFESDLNLATQMGIDVVFAPHDQSELYPDKYTYRVIELDFSKELCGAHRPGHFDGVLTVVLKLLNLSQCNRAYFGEKDFQQLTLIKGMIQAFMLPVDIISIPTIREPSGLALSSRNQRLSPAAKEKASKVYWILKNEKSQKACLEKLNQEGFEVEYLVEKYGRRFIAFIIEGVRLIDNVSLNE
jgi:pantoate--beta-alanine ligase